MLPPPVVIKDVGKIKNPILRVLLYLLIFAAFFFCGAYINTLNGIHNNDEQTKSRMRNKIDSLRNVINVRDDSDNARLRKRLEWYEYLEHELEQKNNKLK